MTAKFKLWGLVYWFGLVIYTLFSYCLVDPNLVLSSKEGLWKIQQILWQIGYHQRGMLSLWYFVIIMILFFSYVGMLKEARKLKSVKSVIIIFLGSVFILFTSYPALSHDIFNYLMNAKMVWWYQANPHVQVAMDFPSDPLLWYMHNTHTPAPYGYGFTLASLIPSVLGQNHLKLTILLFRLMMVLSLAGVAVLQRKMAVTRELVFWTAFLLNPLVLIETIGNIHNDIFMMFLALLSLYLAGRGWRGKKSFWLLLGAGIVYLLSISVKYATVMMIPGLIVYWLAKRYHRPISGGGALAGAMFLPLLTARSQRFLPWYLIWPLAFLPLVRERLFVSTLLAFSASALLAYIPFLMTNNYDAEVQTLRIIITFLPPLSFLLVNLITHRSKQV